MDFGLRCMLRHRLIVSLIPLLAAAALAEAHFGGEPSPCGNGPTALAGDPGRQSGPGITVQLVDDPALADMAYVDDGDGAALCARIPSVPIRFTRSDQADYRLYLRSDRVSPQQAAALLIPMRGTPRPARAVIAAAAATVP